MIIAYFKKILFFIELKKILGISFLAILVTILDVLSISTIPLMVNMVIEGKDFIIFGSNINNLFSLSSTSIIVFLILFVMFGILINTVLKIYRIYFINKECFSFELKFFSYLNNLDYISLKNQNKSAVLTRATEGINKTYRNALESFIILLTNTFFFLFLLCFLLIYNFQFSFFTFFFLTSIFYITHIITKKKVKDISNTSQESAQLKMDTLNNFLSFFSFLKIFNIYDYFYKNYFIAIKTIFKNTVFAYIIFVIPKTIFEVILCLVLIFTILNVGADKSILQIYLPTMILYFFTAYRCFPLANEVFRAIKSIKIYRKFVEDLYQNTSSNDIFKAPLNKIEFKNEKKIIFKKFRKNIIIKNINFAYTASNDFILKIKKFIIKKNQKILIYGDSGQGKSTLFDIIFGLITNKNLEYYVDGKLLNKKEINLFRNNFTFFSPNSYYFNDTVLNNITLFENNDKIKIKNICKIVGLDKLKNKNNKLLHKKMGENGSLFSSGEKQRIALARTLFNNKEIMLLDEPISNLDPKSSNNIIKNILSLNKTIIIISHKKTRYSNYDKIYKFINKKLICEK